VLAFIFGVGVDSHVNQRVRAVVRSIDAERPRLIQVAAACERTREAFPERRRPSAGPGAADLAPAWTAPSRLPPLDDMERVLDHQDVRAQPG
jgi:hypothetical protein